MLGALAALGIALTATAGAATFSTSPRPSYSANKPVFAITVRGDRVYIGGRFTSVRDLSTGTVHPRRGLAAFDASSGALLAPFAPTVNGEIRAIAVSADGSRIYVGGTFTSVNGVARSNIAALDPSGALLPGWNASASRTVRDLVLDGGDLFAAGTFATMNGVNRGGLAKLVSATGALSSWKVPAQGGKPRSIERSPDGTDLIIGGAFTGLEGQPRQFLGAASLDTGVVAAWTPQSPCGTCDIWDVTTSSTDVFAAIGGPGGRLAKWSWATGSRAWTVWADGDVQAVAVLDDVVYAGGHFGPDFGPATRYQLAAVDAGSGQVLPWAPDLGSANFPGVWALDARPDFLRVGGGFTSFDGTPQARYAELPSQ